tara:strand:- start:526 stop:738 length:213 start_codon:yes stop_codon:yes gene_type:complete
MNEINTMLTEFETGLRELVWKYGGNRAITCAIELYRKYLLLEDEFEDYKKKKEEEINSLQKEINELKNKE